MIIVSIFTDIDPSLSASEWTRGHCFDFQSEINELEFCLVVVSVFADIDPRLFVSEESSCFCLLGQIMQQGRRCR